MSTDADHIKPLGEVCVGLADSLVIGTEYESAVNVGLPEGTYPLYGLTDDDERLTAIVVAIGDRAKKLLGVVEREGDEQ